MQSSFAKCPKWLAAHLTDRGGSVPFSQFMDLALNDPINGSYSSGKIKIGVEGDFVTSPSLSNDFAELLAIQVIEWFKVFYIEYPDITTLSLVEIGPGEGDLSFDLIKMLEKISPEIFQKLELILIEINAGMKARQKKRFEAFSNLRIKWLGLNDLSKNPIYGVVLAHEMLDALPVERVVLRNSKLCQVGVTLKEINSEYYLDYIDLPLNDFAKSLLDEYRQNCDLKIPPENSLEGWNTELHTNLGSWFKKVSSALMQGTLLIIDYALEAKRYYSPYRQSGTIVSYSKQNFMPNVLSNPGLCDITSHLCIETLIMEAEKNQFEFIGETMQGLALLSLGLGTRISSLREMRNSDISLALKRRECLLRLIDPSGLGGFRWLLFQINRSMNSSKINFKSSFLEEPNY